MSNILVTGGAGFIGSHLCKALMRDKHRVIILDNFNDFYDPNIKKRNIDELKEMMHNEDLEFNALSVVTGDIREIKTLSRLFEFENIEVVVHLAAMAGVRPSIENPVLYNDVNINGTLNLLEMCKNHKVDKFVFASSSSVYGNNEKVPFSETDNVDYPISPYAATKKAGELLCHTYHKLYDMDMACLRFFTVYGPGQRPDLAIHKFTKLIMDEKEVPFFGDGSTQRDYTYIDDIIDGVTKAITWVCSEKGKYEIFNLGESNTITLKHMVETLEEAIGEKAKLKKMPMQLGDVNRTFADVTKAKQMLGYNPKMDFSEGIRRFVDWYKGVN
jgi:UDP-glucuronate 4-epimerase